MKKRKLHGCSQSRRDFILAGAALAAGILPENVYPAAAPSSISVDLHSHTFLEESEMDGFLSKTGPDVSFISGHPDLGELPLVFESIKKKNIPVARTINDILNAKTQGKRVAMIANEGAYILQGELANLEKFHAMGLISLQLMRAGGGGTVDSRNNLTPFGKEVIQAQNQLGMIIDLAHCRAATIEQVVDATSKPVMLSHMNKPVRETWQLVAETGGIIGNWWSIRDSRKGKTFEDWIEDFSDLVDAVGIDHVGVQTELGTGLHRGPFDSYKDWNTIGEALIENGFSKEESDKILGGNFMRMFAKISI